MYSAQVPNFADRTSYAQDFATKRKLSPVGRIALVAALAGFGIVALATQHVAPADQSSLARVGAAAGFVTDGSTDPEVQLALLADEAYFRVQSLHQTSSNERSVANAEGAPAESPTAEVYLPARFTIDARASDASVVTYEHD